MNTAKSVGLLLMGLVTVGSASVWAGETKIQTPAEFLSKAISCNVEEKDLAEKAVKNAQSADVRKYAQKLVDDHKTNNAKAMKLAGDMKIAVVTGTSKDHRDILMKMTTSTGKDFDEHFLHYMVKAHQKAIKMFEHYAKDGSNEDVRAYATATLPTLREHLELARKLEKNYDAK